MTHPACFLPFHSACLSGVAASASCARPAPFRARDAAQIAHSAATLFLGERSIRVSVATDSGGRLRSIFADIEREYRLRQPRCDSSPDPAAAHAALELDMGVKVLLRLSESLSALFGVHADDAARHAAVMECAAAIADEAVVCHDETLVATPNAPAQRCLTLSAGRAGEIRLHKFSRWQARAGQAVDAQGAPPADPGAPGAPVGLGADMRASLAFQIRPWHRLRRSSPADARRVLLRCRIEPVRVGNPDRMGEAVPTPRPGVRHRIAAGDWRGALRLVLSWLFPRAIRFHPGTVVGRTQLKVYPRPRDLCAPVAVRVGPDWPRREVHRPAIHGIDAVRNELQTAPQGGAQEPDPAPPSQDMDEIRCY